MKCSSQVNAKRGFAAVALSAALACGCFAVAPSAYAETAAEKAAEAESALNQLNAMQETLDQKSSEYYTALEAYQHAIEQRDATQARIDELSAEIAEIQGRLSDRAREMYRHGASSFVDLLLGATSFDEFAKNWDLLNRVNETDAELSLKARTLRDEQKNEYAILDQQAKIAEQKSAEAGAAFEEAKELVLQMQATYESLSAEAQILYAQEQAARAAAYSAAAGGGGGGGYVGGGGGGGGAVTGGVENDDGTVTDVQTGQVYSSASEYSAATGNEIVDRALAMVGSGYRYGSTGSDGYFDCSGLVGYAITGTYDRLGSSSTYMGYEQVSDPQPGDIAVTNGHTGIYIGDGQMVHAADEATGVVVSNVQDGMIFVRY